MFSKSKACNSESKEPYLVRLLEISNELTRIDSFDYLCRRAVELGHNKLGFDRLAIWFKNKKTPDTIVGSFGIDENGRIQDERGDIVSFNNTEVAKEIFSLKSPGVLCKNGALYNHRGKVVGKGTWVCAPMWSGKEIIGYLIMDNLLKQQPITEQKCEVLALYASTLGHLCSRKRMEEALRKSEKRYRELWDNAPVAYHILDTQGIIIKVNKTEAEMLGYKQEEMVGKFIFEFILPEQREEAQKRFREKISGKNVPKAENRIYVRKDGSKIYVFISDVLEHDGEGRVTGIWTTMVDVTERKRIEEALKNSEDQYRTTIDAMGEAIYVIDAEMRIILCNKTLKQWMKELGLESEIVGRTIFDVFPSLSDRARKEYREVFDSGEVMISEEHIQGVRKEFITEIRKIPVFAEKKVVRVVTVIRDITNRKKAEETIRWLAYHDALTGLPNRMLFNNRLALELNRAQRNQQKFAVMLLDLDRFKDVNDTLGHTMGDRLLQHVGKRLENILRKSDTISRMGGDEFIILLPEITGVKDAEKIAEKIIEAIRKPFHIEGHKICITTSIGFSIYPDNGENADTLIRNADIAMYHAKELGRDTYQHYTPEINSDLRDNRRDNSLHKR